MITRALVEKARLHVRQFFRKHIPGHLLYHNLEHTLTVARTAMMIGRAENLGDQALLVVEMAALFHDTGYAKAYATHEEESAKLATAWLEASGVDGPTIGKVARLIHATRLDQEPQGKDQQVLRDADSAKAGQADFLEKGEQLRLEREIELGRRIPLDTWHMDNLAYLQAHRFHTPCAQERFGGQKAINLQMLSQLAACQRTSR